MLQTILLVVMTLISIFLIGVVLIQRSEGGALGMGGGGGGLMSARGAGNLLTRITWILGLLFAAVAISLTIVGNMDRNAGSVLDSSIVGGIDVTAPVAGGEAPAATEAPAAPSGPSLDDLEAASRQAAE